MAKYVYPAIFTEEDDGKYSVHFPDLESCYTSGDDLADAIEMASDVLALVLYGMEDDGKPIPAPSSMQAIAAPEKGLVSLIACDTIAYRRLYDKKAVKKTVTLPHWLNVMAEKKGVNFSGILQEGLKQELDISD